MNKEIENIETNAPQKRRSLLSVILWMFLGIISFLLLLMGIQIDDWQRDLSINWAKTEVDAKDPLLRPIRIQGSIQDTQKLIQDVISQMNRWKEGKQVQELGTGEVSTLRLERTTGLMRFVDDVTVRLVRQEDFVLVQIESRSRVGKADLGQNPRNIKELNAAIDAAIKRQMPAQSGQTSKLGT